MVLPLARVRQRERRVRRRPARLHGEPIRRPAAWYLLATVVATLTIIGLVMVLSASSVQSQREGHSVFSYFVKQVMWAVVGLLALVGTARYDYHRWRRWIPAMLLTSAALLVAVLVPGIGLEINGARSWLGIGPLSLQPAEVVKPVLVLFTADLLARRADRVHDSRTALRPVLVVTGVFSVLLMLQPALGSTLVLAALVLGVVVVAGVPGRQLTSTGLAAAALTTVLAVVAPYRRRRVLAFLHPSADPRNTGYQLNQSLMGVATGHLFGLGLGQSRAKWGFLPNASTDLIFAIIAEELGLVGAVIVIGLFLLLGVIGIRTALRAPDRFGMLVAAGLTTWILAEALINIGSALGLLPLAGLTLPYISYGGTSLVITLAASGLLMNIAAQSN